MKTLPETLLETERQYLVDVMTQTRGNISKAALLAGICRQTFHEKVRKYGLQRVRPIKPHVIQRRAFGANVPSP